MDNHEKTFAQTVETKKDVEIPFRTYFPNDYSEGSRMQITSSEKPSRHEAFPDIVLGGALEVALVLLHLVRRVVGLDKQTKRN